MCQIHIFLSSGGEPARGSAASQRAAVFLCPHCNAHSAECPYCGGMAKQMQSRARWEETLSIQKRRLGKRQKSFDAKLSFDTFDLFLRELEETRSKNGLGRLLKPNVLDQIKDFTAAITTLSQLSDPTLIVWGSLQAVLKLAYDYADTVSIIAEMVSDMTQSLPLFEKYRSMFPTAYELEEPLRELYFHYVGFCIDVVLFFESKKWKLLIRLSFRNLRKRFEETRRNIAKQASTFNVQVDIARTRLGVRAHEHIINLSNVNFRRQTVISGVPCHKNFRFQGRESVLEEVHKQLHSKDAAHSQMSTVIHGMGGVGKTQVALEYTYRHREDYSYIFWVRAETSAELTVSFASLARSLIPGSMVQDQIANVKLVRDWMTQNDRWLIVFDNADAQDVDLSPFWPPTAHGSILITTQRRNFTFWAASSIHLDTFEEDEGSRLILGAVTHSGRGHSDETVKVARDISIELGGLPLLLTHIAGYIAGTGAPLDGILENLRQPSEFKKIWAFDSVASTNFQYGEPMTKVWRLALDSLRPDALSTLHIMAMLNTDEVYENMLFGDWADDELGFLKEDKRFEFNNIRGNLIDRHLIDVGTESGKLRLSMHRVLKRHILQRMDDEGDELLSLNFQRAVRMVRREIPQADELQTPTSDAWIESERCIPHVLSLVAVYQDWAPKIRPSLEFATTLADTGTNYMWSHGQWRDAVKMLAVGERVCEELSHLDEINLVHADICAISGSVHEDIGFSGRQTALKACEKALRLREEMVRKAEAAGQSITPSSILQLANARNDVGVVVLSYGRFEEAIPHFLESLRLKRLHRTEENLAWHFGETFKNMAIVKLYQGDMAGAETEARRSRELCSQGRDQKDAATQSANSVLGIVLMNVGKIDEALVLFKEAYRERREMLGETSMETKNSLYLVAETYRLQGKSDKSESKFRLALEDCELSWSDEAIARAKYHLALVIKSMPEKLSSKRQREVEELTNSARRTRDRISEPFSSAVSQEKELEMLDFMVSFLAGRWINPRQGAG